MSADLKKTPSMKGAAKNWAKEYWLLTPLNLLGFGLIFAPLKWLCAVLGPHAYGTVVGNLKLSGILLLTAIVSALLVSISSSIFKIKEIEGKREAFWLMGIWILIGIAGCFISFGRAMLMLIGVIDRGGQPPQFLLWLFESIHQLIELGT